MNSNPHGLTPFPTSMKTMFRKSIFSVIIMVNLFACLTGAGLSGGEKRSKYLGASVSVKNDLYIFRNNYSDLLYIGANYGIGTPAPFLPHDVLLVNIGQSYLGNEIVDVVPAGTQYCIERVESAKEGGARRITFLGRIYFGGKEYKVSSDYLQVSWYVDSEDKVVFIDELVSFENQQKTSKPTKDDALKKSQVMGLGAGGRWFGQIKEDEPSLFDKLRVLSPSALLRA